MNKILALNINAIGKIHKNYHPDPMKAGIYVHTIGDSYGALISEEQYEKLKKSIKKHKTANDDLLFLEEKE